MRILLLSQILPHPPDSGPKIKTWNLIRYLAMRHEVTLVSFVRDESPADLDALRQHCREVVTVRMRRGKLRDAWALLRSLSRPEPWLMLRDARRAMHRRVAEVTSREHFDLVYADQLNMCQYAEEMRGSARVFDAHNALWLLCSRLGATLRPGPKRWFLRREEKRLSRYEAHICREFEATTAVTAADKGALEKAGGPSSRITVVPIAIDARGRPTATTRAHAPERLAFVGTMFWPPNVNGVRWFCREVWPLVRHARPGAQLEVVGARPPRSVLELANTSPGVRVSGYVDDLSASLQECRALIVPLRAGGGMRVKILDALARGVPVVSTTMGCEGIQVTPERDILIADTPESFASATVRVLSDDTLRRQLAENGRRLVESSYDYRTALSAIDSVLIAALEEGKRVGPP